MNLEELIRQARAAGASDLHLEAGLTPRIRAQGELQLVAAPLAGDRIAAMAHTLLGEAGWRRFVERGSADFSRSLAGARCRINVLRTRRGVGLAIRLLPSQVPSLQSLNLHPELGDLTAELHGLVIVSGPTGCGKSSTLAALVQRIHLARPCHIITLESPIEHSYQPQRSLIRQREIGRDSPSFEQALIDAMREDPDVIMVGEMRQPEVMRLTLNAAETGHLVLATMHSGTVVDALQRIVSAFPAESQPAVQIQLADCLRAVVCQRLVFRPEWGVRLPECEVLRATSAVRGVLRLGSLFKLQAVLETGAPDRQWSFERYRAWIDRNEDWHLPDPAATDPVAEPEQEPEATRDETADGMTDAEPFQPAAHGPRARRPPVREEDVIELREPDQSLQDILSELKED